VVAQGGDAALEGDAIVGFLFATGRGKHLS